jgi:V8-like Glu-specific endopeptidase
MKPGWLRDQDRNFDYGAIFLPKNRPLGAQTGYFGFANFADTELNGKMGNIAGYPVDKGASTMWYHARPLGKIDRNVIYYTIDTAGGHSGAPLWILLNGKTYVVGIHTNGDVGSGNSATRLTKPVYDQIHRWKNYRGP